MMHIFIEALLLLQLTEIKILHIVTIDWRNSALIL